jgi:hypothetical protein
MNRKPTLKIRRLNFEHKVAKDDSPAWSLAYIIDETSFKMMDVKVPFCMLTGLTSEARKQDPRNLGRGVPRRLYEEQARFKIYRIPIFRPPPVFVVYLKHLNDRLKQELSSLDRESRDFVLREAIDRIFGRVDKRFYLQSAKPLLKWRFEN